jgi:Tfp pilus assembly protein PilF
VVNPNATRIRIEQVEEDINAGKVPAAQVSEKYIDLADDYVDLGQRERALDCLHKALKKRTEPSAWILNRMGIICGQIGDHARQEKLYREAATLDPHWGMPLFNLALAQQRRGQFEEAHATIDEALERERRAPFLILQAEIADSAKDAARRNGALRDGLALFGPVGRLDDWELGWCLAGAKMARDEKLTKEVEDERQTRAARRNVPAAGTGYLPIRRS